MKINGNEIRPGNVIQHKGALWVAVKTQHVKPGKGGAFVRTKVKNLKTGRVLDRTFRSGEKVEEADVAERKMQYLYQDGEDLVFMDTETFEQIPFSSEQVGEARKWLKENLDVEVLFWRGQPINLEIPSFVAYTITRCDPGLKGDTAQGATKPATLETGAVVQVPLFVKEGERIRVDTRSGEYFERVN